jgi:hypothetical protein
VPTRTPDEGPGDRHDGHYCHRDEETGIHPSDDCVPSLKKEEFRSFRSRDDGRPTGTVYPPDGAFIAAESVYAARSGRNRSANPEMIDCR